MDLLRKKGDQSFYEDRFDYDFTNIYRSTQDADLVVDGMESQAQELEHFIQVNLIHLLGTKAKWEVRLLKEARGDKEALLNDSQFLNQHTDSHSVGMIELTKTENDSSRVKDLRDWNSKSPNFLEDVRKGQLKFYYSEKHRETNRFKEGKNPEILSVVRYMTNLNRFGLKPDRADEAYLRKIIQEFIPKDPQRHPYVTEWFNKNGRKLLLHAIDLERAWNLLERSGLRKKLLETGDVNDIESMPWWLNREPLRSFELGTGAGKTAQELEITMLAHDTRSMEAYEIITYSHRGLANVLISRDTVPGESAVMGDGFYTKMGHEGAWQNGLSIRFDLDPRAREGTDFIKQGEVVIVKNRNAIRVIPESIRLNALEYIRLLKEQKFERSDRGPLEKFKRRLRAHLQFIGDEEAGRIAKEFQGLSHWNFTMGVDTKIQVVILEILSLMRSNRKFIEQCDFSLLDWLRISKSSSRDFSLGVLEFLHSQKEWVSEHFSEEHLKWIEAQDYQPEYFYFWVPLIGMLDKLPKDRFPRAEPLANRIGQTIEKSILDELNKVEAQYNKRLAENIEYLRKKYSSLAEDEFALALEKKLAPEVGLHTAILINTLIFVGAIDRTHGFTMRQELKQIFGIPGLFERMPKLKEKMIKAFEKGTGPLWVLSAESLTEFVTQPAADEYIYEFESGIRRRPKFDFDVSEILTKVLARKDWKLQSKMHLMALRKYPNFEKLLKSSSIDWQDAESVLAVMEHAKEAHVEDRITELAQQLSGTPEIFNQFNELSALIARKAYWGTKLSKRISPNNRVGIYVSYQRSPHLLFFDTATYLYKSLRDLPHRAGISLLRSCARDIAKIRGRAPYLQLRK